MTVFPVSRGCAVRIHTRTPAVALAGIMRACYLDLYIAAGYLKAA